jgi:hypothetical protein
MKGRTIVAILAAVVALGWAATGVAAASPKQSGPAAAACNPPAPPPMPPASDFVRKVDNPYFPLPPGTTLTYHGQEDGDRILDQVTVTDRTKVILDVPATVVSDRVMVNGLPSEQTFDWYAQDKQGNVWYLGESAYDFEHGHWVRADDSWESGRDGAEPGIIMEAHPAVHDVYAQEHLPGTALDMARVISTDATVVVPYGTFTHVVETTECTPLEPGVVDLKYYGAGVGEVGEATVQGGSAKLVLVSVTRG